MLRCKLQTATRANPKIKLRLSAHNREKHPPSAAPSKAQLQGARNSAKADSDSSNLVIS